MAQIAVVLLAAGGSTRFRDRDKKPYADLDGRAVWLRSLELCAIREDICQILIVIAKEDKDLFERRYRANVAFLPNAKMVMGGKERADSVQNALAQCTPDAEFVAIHDTARACLTAELMEAVFSAGVKTGAAVLAVPVSDTIKRADSDRQVIETVPRAGLWSVQTPQVFRRQLLLDAYARRDASKPVTDDAQLVEATGATVTLVESDPTNIKITTKSDLILAAAILKSRPKKDKGGLHPFSDDQMWR